MASRHDSGGGRGVAQKISVTWQFSTLDKLEINH